MGSLVMMNVLILDEDQGDPEWYAELKGYYPVLVLLLRGAGRGRLETDLTFGSFTQSCCSRDLNLCFHADSPSHFHCFGAMVVVVCRVDLKRRPLIMLAGIFWTVYLKRTGFGKDGGGR